MVLASVVMTVAGSTTAFSTSVPEPPVPTETTEPPATTEPPVTTVPPVTTEPPVTTAPDTTGPDTTGPDTTGPDTTGPETTAPVPTGSLPPESLPPDTSEPPIVAFDADPTGMISVDKTNTADGAVPSDFGTVAPGETFTYHFEVDCSSPLQDCVNFTFTDTIPLDVAVDVDSLPESVPGSREVTWDEATHTLTVRYIAILDNPFGTGLPAGGGDTFDVTVTLPADTGLPDGHQIVNEATVTADNVAEPATDETTVEVDIPRVVEVATQKSVTPGAVISTDPDAAPVISLSGTNNSSSTAAVDEIVFEDATAQMWEYFDLTSAAVTAWPAEAETATLRVCAAPGPCPPGAWTDVETIANPAAAFTIPAAVAANAVGVQIAFASTDGEPIARGATGGVDLGTHLRETTRAGGADISADPNTVAFDNCVTTTARDPGDPAATPPLPPLSGSAQDCAPVQVLPPTVDIGVSKSFFADGNGNFQTDPGEHAVIGENSGVSMVMNAVNNSAFPISNITITEPVDPNEFDKFDAASIRLTIPATTTSVHVEVTYDSGPPDVYDCAPVACPNPIAVDSPPARRVTQVVVTYTGEDTGTDPPTPLIDPGSTAGLGIHGRLNDLVDDTDIPGPGELAGVANCAGFESQTVVPGSTGSFAGTACDLLPVEARGAGTGGEKVPSQDAIPPDQGVLFTMRTTNNGNLPLYNVMVSDPPAGPGGVPPLTDTFQYMAFIGADIQPAAMQGRVTIEVYTPAGGWQPFTPISPPPPPQPGWEDIIGVRATIAYLLPTESFDLRIGVQLRPEVDPAEVPPISNCYNVTAGDSGDDGGPDEPYVSENYCNPPLEPQPNVESAVLNKFITPETMPRPIPGLVSGPATVQLRVQNNGTLTMQYLRATDDDADFWDAVDFVGFGSITPPAVGELLRADILRVDAYVGGAWVLGTPGSPSSPSLPAGVAAGQVRGLRFTFSSTSVLNGGFVITPCPTNGTCAAVINFRVRPRIYLVSTGEPVPEQLLDTATGGFNTQLHPDTDNLQPIPPATDNLDFVEGDPRIDVVKLPDNRTVTPGQLSTFNLTVRNNGTANLPDLTVADPLPSGLLFDDTFAGDGGQPYTVVWSNLPSGYPAPPDAVFITLPDPVQTDRVGLVAWQFPGWDMPPNAQVVITYRYSLEPGVLAGDIITNTMGASSPVDDLACTPPDVPIDAATTPWGAVGIYCTDPANVTVAAGANFVSRKWVAGNPELGWYNQSTGELVPVGGGGCLSLSANGRTYTTNPCIALVNPGEQFHYVLRVQNAGTQPATRMVVMDSFPAPGDLSVLGTPRGTQWATAPTLAGPATYSGPATGTLSYTSGALCNRDLFFDLPPCPPGDWADPPGPSTTALKLSAVFDPADYLDPGEEIQIAFSMTTPVEVPWVADPTIAWNSLAHAESYLAGDVQFDLRPLEPLRVGVATMYGDLEVVKEIGDNPGGLPLDDLEFTFAYDCTLTNGLPGGSGTVTATPATPGVVEHLPAGATCSVWETGTNGGIPDATVGDPVSVVIDPSLAADPPVLSSVTVTNDFPLGRFEVLKALGGDVDPDLVGPFPVTVDCAFAGEQLAGFPMDVELVPGEPQGVDVPIGTECTVVETDAGGATVTYDPANAAGDAGQAVVPPDGDQSVTVTITNTFATGSLVIAKEASGPGVPEFSQGPFTFDVTCSYLGNQDVYSVVVVGSADGSPVESDPITGLPIGAECTVTEVDSGGADLVADPVTVTIEAGEEANVTFVGVNNPFSAGTIAVAKVVDGSAAGAFAGETFTIAVECAVASDDGALTTLVDTTVEVTGDGTPVTVTGDDGTPALLPLGARCWGSELASLGATDVVIDHDSYANGMEVVADADGGVQELLITVTNTFEAARLTVTKVVVDEPDPAEEYTFGIACSITAADGSVIDAPPLTGTTPFTLGAGESATFDVLVGATCSVRETSTPAGATITYAETGGAGGASGDGVVTIGPDAAVTVTNTFDSGVGPDTDADDDELPPSA